MDEGNASPKKEMQDIGGPTKGKIQSNEEVLGGRVP